MPPSLPHTREHLGLAHGRVFALGQSRLGRPGGFNEDSSRAGNVVISENPLGLVFIKPQRYPPNL